MRSPVLDPSPSSSSGSIVGRRANRTRSAQAGYLPSDMPRYRFSWDAFNDDTVEGLARSLGFHPDEHDESSREFLDRRCKRPNAAFVKAHSDAILEAWVAHREATARHLYQRLVDAGLGPADYRPRSQRGYLNFLARTKKAKRFCEFMAEAMIAFGDQDRASDDDANPKFIPRFEIVPVAEVPVDGRKPHDYQQEAWDRLGAHLADASADGVFQGLLVMPTGAGKTFTAVRWLTTEVIARGGRVVWLAHRQELLEHAASEFRRTATFASGREKLRIRVVSGAHSPTTSIHPEDDVVVASIASLARRPDIRDDLMADPRTFVVVDEAHHAPAKSYRDLLKELAKRKKFRVLGLTATPTRTLEDERPLLGRLFGNRILYQIGLRSLIERGTLARPRVVRVHTGADAESEVSEKDLTHLARFQDLSEEWLDRIAHLAGRNDAIVSHYLEHREKYGQTLVFAINVDHAALLTAHFRDEGVEADYVASRRPDGTDGDPTAVIQRFRDGGLDVLVNVQMVTEGVDVPGIQTVFLSRPTSSEILLRQMIGRALRGPSAGGTETAYLVSFEDHWGRFTDWESPFDRLPDIVIESERTTAEESEAETGEAEEPTLRAELVEAMPWDMVTAAARELRRLRASAPVMAFEAVPHGWYVFEHDGDEDHEGMRHVVAYYAHQLPCWEHALEHLWSGSVKKAGGLVVEDLDEFFADCDEPRPSRHDVAKAILLRSLDADRPEPIAFEARAESEPRAVAQRIIDQDLGPRAAADLIESTYGKLARAVYPTRRDYQLAVDSARDAILYPKDSLYVPKAVPIFELGDDRFLTPGPHHDLEVLFEEVRPAAAGLLGLSALPHEGPIVWTGRFLKGWYAMANWDLDAPHGHGRIRVNKLLNSPDVPTEVLRWLLWHEYLHLHLQDGHTRTFRDLERRWPGCIEAERFLDTLNERFGAQAW